MVECPPFSANFKERLTTALPVVPHLVVTQGDPGGIGPELLLRLGDAGALRTGDRVVADRDGLERLARALGTDWAARGFEAVAPLVDDVRGGQVAALVRAVDLVLAEPGLALVTAPIDKAACRAEGFAFPGHTEYLAARAGVRDFAMLMSGPRLRVVPVTIHVPLRDVPRLLTQAAIVRCGKLLADTLHRHLGLDAPRIGVLGLNPHAGERGLLGDEEQRVIAPAIDELTGWAGAAGLPCSFVGPLAADSAFVTHAEGGLDGLLAMYHDQGLGPFKLLHMRDGVNMTLGLPFTRTSPDHGTARDIAGRGVADASSMLAAVALARGHVP